MRHGRRRLPPPARRRFAVVGAAALVLAALAALAVSSLPRQEPDRAPSASAPRDPALRFGVNAGGLEIVPSAEAAARLGARHARVEFSIGAPASELREAVAAYAEHGVAVLPQAGFYGRMPTVEEARNLAGWAAEFGPGGRFWASRDDGHLAITAIEFGNESSYGYMGTQDRGGEYAERLRDAHDAIQGEAGNARVGLLAQADDANTRDDDWVRFMFEAVPDLASRVAGWTIHPYGPDWEDRIERLIDQTEDQGAPDHIPIHVTEWGLSTDDGRCLSGNYGWDPCMDYDEAAETLRETAAAMRERFGDRLRSFYLYQGTDQRPPGETAEREHYFGALQRDLERKGAYTDEVRRQLRGAPD